MHFHHVLAENIDLQKQYLSIKLPNTFDIRDTVQKGATKLPDYLHKGLLYDIILRGALDFIKHEKYGHHYE